MAVLVITTIFYVMLYLDEVPNTTKKLLPYSLRVGNGAILAVFLVIRQYLLFWMPRPGPADAGHPALNLIAKGVHFLLDAGLYWYVQ